MRLLKAKPVAPELFIRLLPDWLFPSRQSVTRSNARHLERVPAQHGQTYDPLEDRAVRIPVLKRHAATFQIAPRCCARCYSAA